MVFLLFHTCPVKFMDSEEGGGPGGTGFTSMGQMTCPAVVLGEVDKGSLLPWR